MTAEPPARDTTAARARAIALIAASFAAFAAWVRAKGT
jgi:hypothetical protein